MAIRVLDSDCHFVLSLTACDCGCDNVPLVDTFVCKVFVFLLGGMAVGDFADTSLCFVDFGTARSCTAEERFVAMLVERCFTLGNMTSRSL